MNAASMDIKTAFDVAKPKLIAKIMGDQNVRLASGNGQSERKGRL